MAECPSMVRFLRMTRILFLNGLLTKNNNDIISFRHERRPNMTPTIKITAVYTFIISLMVVVFINTTDVKAEGYPWRNHAEPFDFLFDNHMDAHQQTRLDEKSDLFGFLYITIIGDKNGIPIAEHCDGNTPPEECEVGWIIRGKPGAAIFVFHEFDHPLWLVQSRNDIPQPGAYSLFHWTDGPQGAGDLVEETLYNGYFLELQAVDKFIFRHSGEDILVKPGIDISTHVNIVGSFPIPEP